MSGYRLWDIQVRLDAPAIAWLKLRLYYRRGRSRRFPQVSARNRRHHERRWHVPLNVKIVARHRKVRRWLVFT